MVLSGMGEDELFGGIASIWPAGLRLPTFPGPSGRAVRPTLDCLPVSDQRSRAEARPLGEAVPEVRRAPREAGFRRSYTLYDASELAEPLDPGLAGPSTTSLTSTEVSLCGLGTQRPCESDVPGRQPAVPPGAQPRLHRPRQHGRFHRGTRPFRGPVVAARRLLAPRVERRSRGRTTTRWP